MAGYKETFGSNVDYAYGRSTDMTSRLQSGVSSMAGAGKGLADMVARSRDARRGIKDLNSEMGDLKQRIDAATDPAEFARLTKEMNRAKAAAGKLSKQLTQMPFDSLEKGLGKLTGGLIGFNASILKISFGFLIDSIKRVYELQERWTKAIGGFNMKLGGMTAGLKGAQVAATQWSSTIRGLTNGDIQEGIQMFGEFTMAIGRTVKAGDGFSKLGVQLARGFGLGGAGAGQIVKVFENIGMSAEDSAKAMKTSIAAANAAGIPVNMLADDLAKSSTYMARFGKEGQKTLIQGAAWARKYDITLQQLRQTVEGFDTFDEAAKSAASLNSAFGTMINSMDLMMEDDPAKRLDMIRQQMLAQGMTYDKLSPKQRRYFTETMHLSEEQTAALLDATNAGESYSDFQAKAVAQEKKEADAKKLMQKQLQSTVQTMYAFGMAFDRITVAIAKAIRPLLEVLGLAKAGGKDFKSFGGVMESITKTVEAFFISLSKNDRWMGFMRELGKDLQRAGTGLKSFVMDGRAADLVGDLAKGMKSFYTTVRDFVIKLSPMFRPALDLILKLSTYIKELSYAWAGMKVFNMFGGTDMLGNVAGMLGGKGKGGKAGGVGGMLRGGGRMAMAGAAGAVGGAIGGAGAGVGASVGSMIGSFMGPMGMVLGPIIGGLAGKAISWIFGSPKVKSELDKARDDLNASIEKEKKRREHLESILDVASAKQNSQDKIRQSSNQILKAMEETALKQKGKMLTLNEQEVEMLKSRANELSMFGKGTKGTKELIEKLGVGSKISADELKRLITGSQNYEVELQKLRDATQKQADLEMARLQVSNIGQQKEALEMTTKLHDMELKAAKEKLKDMGGKLDLNAHKQGWGGTSTFHTFEEKMDMLKGQAAAWDKELQQNNLAPERKRWLEQMKEYTAKQLAQGELEAKINRLEMQNTKDKKSLVEAQADYFKQEVILNLKRAIKSDTQFLDFTKTDAAQGKTMDQQMMAFLESGQSVLGNNPEVKALLAEGLDFSGIAKAKPSSATIEPIMSPMSNFQAPSMLAPPTNFANTPASSPASSPVVVQVNNNLTLDGMNLLNGLASTSIRTQ